MNLTDEMITTFGWKHLVYANPERVHDINFPHHKIKEFILNTGFPRVVDHLRFSMDFEPILEDTRIGISFPNLHQVFTIGCIGLNRLINTLVPLSKIGLNDNSSLSDIDRKIEALGIPDDAVFSTEVEFAHRVCIDNSNNGEIISINPENLSITLFNSSIEHLAASVIVYKNCFFSQESTYVQTERFESQMQKIDPKALENPQSFWPLIVEQYKLAPDDDYEYGDED